MGPAHIHTGTAQAGGTRRDLALTIGVTGFVMLVEIAGGLRANSLALLSDAGHMLTDLLALAMALFAVVVACRPATARKTYGYHRVEILSALTNGILLAVISLVIFVEAWRRLMDPQPVSGGLVMAVAAVGLAANLVCYAILSRSSRSINVRSARMHVTGDALSSAGVIGGGVIISMTSWYRIDALLSFAIGVAILVGAYRIVRETVDILLEGTPRGLDPAEVARAIETMPGVRGVHDLHIWCITSGMTALSGHVILDGAALARSDDALNHMKEMLRLRFLIEHTTIQIESESYTEVGEVH
ncbi:MAG TPA: cation diffusion facilitator family transporter [Candidatus Polarisedimenticolia bacterium]|nr:cation diffusion facilitator family transporter [Candidatus Polarisedimenticolia bacterium]